MKAEAADAKVSCMLLFWTFAKIGAFTFGGGWAMISIIEREVVDKRHWLERTEFLDLLAVAQSLPGILAVNIAVVVGDKLRSLKGSLAASAGTIMPCFLIILAIAMFLTPETITGNPVLSAIFKGIRPVVVALRLEAGMDSGGGGAADMVEDSISVQSYSVYRARRTCGIPACEESTQKA